MNMLVDLHLYSARVLAMSGLRKLLYSQFKFKYKKFSGIILRHLNRGPYHLLGFIALCPSSMRCLAQSEPAWHPSLYSS